MQKKVAKEDKRKGGSNESEEEKRDINEMVTVGDPNSLNDMDSEEKRSAVTVTTDPSFLSDSDSIALLETSLTMIILR